jgi:hypothetical protein
MKMPKEYVLILIVGLFLFAYLLEAVVDPLNLPLSNPYQFLTSAHLGKYPFTTAVIAIRSLAILMSPLWLLSFIPTAFQFKAVATLVISVLIQLYGVQGMSSATATIPQEWAISFALGGATLLLFVLFYFAKGAVTPKKSVASKNIGTLTDTDDGFDDDDI